MKNQKRADKPTGLTDEQKDTEINRMWAHAYQMSVFERKELRELCSCIEAIVRKDDERTLDCHHPVACYSEGHKDCLWCMDADNYEEMLESVRKDAQRPGIQCPVCWNPYTSIQVTKDRINHFCQACEKEKARKDERERAANKALMAGDCGAQRNCARVIADAILQGEE